MAFAARPTALENLRLLRHVGRQSGKTLHQPIVRVERARRAEVLLHPRDRLVAHVYRLCHHHSDKRADRSRHEKEEDEERQDRGQRAAAAHQPLHPVIKRPA